MKKIGIIFCALLLLCLNTKVEAQIIKTPTANAKGAVLMDLNSGQLLYEKNSHGRYPPASTTKIMTALLTLEKCKLDEKVIVGKNPPYEDGSKIYLINGEELTVQQLLYALLLESANDAALALAEHISGSKEAFAQLMNQRAKELGCTDTHFVNPNGLYDKNHYTSARDLALITEKAMENPIFRKMVSTTSYNLPPTNKQKLTRYFHNHNKLLTVKKDKYPGGDGVKTGYTVKSKHTYVGSATRNGRTLIATFLYDDKTYYQETAALFNYGFSNFIDDKILSKSTIAGTLKLKDDKTEIPVYPEKDIYITIPKGTKPIIKPIIYYKDALTKVTKGEIVGTISISSLTTGKISVNLISSKDYEIKKALLPSANKFIKNVFKLSNIKYPFIALLLTFLSRGFYRKYKKKRNLYKY